MRDANDMTPEFRELYTMLAEEAAEVVKCCMKILRHGEYSYNPDIEGGPSNIEHLRRELTDLEAIMDLHHEATIRNFQDGPRQSLYPEVKKVKEAMAKKLRYMHHSTATGL